MSQEAARPNLWHERLKDKLLQLLSIATNSKLKKYEIKFNSEENRNLQQINSLFDQYLSNKNVENKRHIFGRIAKKTITIEGNKTVKYFLISSATNLEGAYQLGSTSWNLTLVNKDAPYLILKNLPYNANKQFLDEIGNLFGDYTFCHIKNPANSLSIGLGFLHFNKIYKDIIDIKEIALENNKTIKICIPKKVRENQDFFTERPNSKEEERKEEKKDEGLEDDKQINENEKKEGSDNNNNQENKEKKNEEHKKVEPKNNEGNESEGGIKGKEEEIKKNEDGNENKNKENLNKPILISKKTNNDMDIDDKAEEKKEGKGKKTFKTNETNKTKEKSKKKKIIEKEMKTPEKMTGSKRLNFDRSPSNASPASKQNKNESDEDSSNPQ